MTGRKPWNVGLTKKTHPNIESTSQKLKKYVGENRPWDNGLKAGLTREDLEPFMLEGKVVVAKAMVHLGYSYPTIKKECRRLGLRRHKHAISETVCCETLSKLLGGVPYVPEWNDPRFVNPETGRRFRYDGFFESHGLVVEFHGYQHWTFPSVFFPYEELRSEWEAMRKRDSLKRRLIEETRGLRFLCIREDEKFQDSGYLRTRLKDVGILV